MSGRKMEARIPVTTEVQRVVRAYAEAAGATYDDLLREWLEAAGVPEMDEKLAAMAGAKRRGEIPTLDERELKQRTKRNPRGGQ